MIRVNTPLFPGTITIPVHEENDPGDSVQYS